MQNSPSDLLYCVYPFCVYALLCLLFDQNLILYTSEAMYIIGLLHVLISVLVINAHYFI